MYDFDAAPRYWRPRWLKILKHTFYLFQSFFQLVAGLPKSTQINLHLPILRLLDTGWTRTLQLLPSI